MAIREPVPNWPPRIGAAFKNTDNATPDHLWVVCSKPTTDSRVAVLNLTSFRDGCDGTCRISAGEHPFVVKETIVAYQHHAMMTREAFDILVSRGWYHPWPDLSAGLLRRIQEGALSSKYLPEKEKVAIRAGMAG